MHDPVQCYESKQEMWWVSNEIAINQSLYDKRDSSLYDVE